MRPANWFLSLAAALSVVVAGCAPKGLHAGIEAETLQDYDRAVVEYTRVVREHPDNREARQGLSRAKMRASMEHFSRGRRLAQGGRLEEAVLDLQVALELNPTSPDIEALLTSVRSQLKTKIAVSRQGKTELESLIDRARTLPAPSLTLPDVQMPASLSWNGSARMLLLQLGKIANISVVFDPQFRDQDLNVDLRGSLEDSLKTVTAATRSFYRVTAQRAVTIAPDTQAKRQEYDEEIVKVFPLSNADVKEVSDILRIVIDARRLSATTANNTIAVKDTPERVEAAGRLIAAIDKARPEVVIDVEILEVDRTRLQEYGLQVATPGVPNGISGAITIERDPLTLADLGTLSRSDVFLTPLPGLFYRLLKTDTHTRALANTQIRLSDGQPGRASFGEEVPVPVTVFSPIATGGVNQQPITSYNYKTVGVNIDITPRTHHNDDVTLALKLEVSSISGTGFGNLPTFGSRAIDTVNRLRDGETNLLAGLIRDDDRRVKEGVPGLVDIPAIGHLFAHNRQEAHQSDVVITLTPHIIRVLDVTEADLRAFQAGNAGDRGLNILLPLPGTGNAPGEVIVPQPGQQPAIGQPAPQQPAQPPPPGPATPIFPPQQPPTQPPTTQKP
jgi:general secretion pathway protein D